MEVVKNAIEKLKVLASKLGVFNIVWLIALLFSLYYVNSIAWPTSFLSLELVFDRDVIVEDYQILLEEELLETHNEVSGNRVIFSNLVCGDEIEALKVVLKSSDVKMVSVNLGSRFQIIETFDVQDTDIITEIVDENTSYIFSESFLQNINASAGYDWKLHIEVMLCVAVFFVVIKIIELFFSYKLYKKFKYVCLFVVLMMLVTVYGNNTVATYVNDLHITGTLSMTPVLEEEFFYQSFVPNKKTTGIGVRLATYGQELEGVYELRIYDAEGNQVVTQTIQGPDIIDNEYYKVDFIQKLDAEEIHKFTVVKTDTEYTEEQMCLWRTEIDHYPDGELTDSLTGMIGDVEFELYEEGWHMKGYLTFLVVVFFVLLLICKRGNEDKTNFTKYVIAVYGGILVVFISQVMYHIDYSDLGIYDEMAQVSFVSYFAENPEVIVPDYKEATLLIPDAMKPSENGSDVYALNQNKGIFYGRNTNTINYLFHPALYYKLMSMTNCVTSDGELVHVNIDRLRWANVGIIVLGLLVTFYLGVTRIKKDMYYHLLFGAICISIPSLTRMAPMVNNDNLCFLAIALYMLGVVRVIENKRNIWSYLFIAIGIVMAALTKHTALLFVAFISIFVVARLMIKEKSIKVLWNKEFFVTLPLYIIVVAYYLGVYMKCGSFRPSLATVSGDDLYNYSVLIKDYSERTYMSVTGLMQYFYNTFMTMWNQVAIRLVSNGAINNFVLFLRNLIFILPMVLPFINLKSKKKDNIVYRMLFEGAVIAVYFGILHQLIGGISSFYGFSGRLACQSRYYFCMLPIFAFCIINFLTTKVEEHYGNNTKITIGEKCITIDNVIHFITCVCVLGLLVV